VAVCVRDAGFAASRCPSPDHPDTLKPRHDLATGYAEAARTAVAIRFPEQMLNDRERVLGRRYPGALMLQNNPATVYQEAEGQTR
jgi:hypothetical protein